MVVVGFAAGTVVEEEYDWELVEIGIGDQG